MDLLVGLSIVAALVLALVYVRRVARRDRLAALRRPKPPPKRAVRSLSQRSEMRSADPITVMDDLKRTNSRRMAETPERSQSRRKRAASR